MAKTTTVSENLTDTQIDQLAKEAGKSINELPKVRIKIPKDHLNKEDTVVPVTINGYTWSIKRGESVEVPENVAFILEEAGYI